MNDKPKATTYQVDGTYRGVHWVGTITELRGDHDVGYFVAVKVGDFPRHDDAEEGHKSRESAEARCRELAQALIDQQN